jgi:hypothetical protein
MFCSLLWRRSPYQIACGLLRIDTVGSWIRVSKKKPSRLLMNRGDPPRQLYPDRNIESTGVEKALISQATKPSINMPTIYANNRASPLSSVKPLSLLANLAC